MARPRPAAEPPTRRAGARPRPPRSTTHSEQTAGTQGGGPTRGPSVAHPRWQRQAPTFAHVAA
jgi:hypothetical protein